MDIRRWKLLGCLCACLGVGCSDAVGPDGSGTYDFPEGKVYFSSAPIDLGLVESFFPMGGPNVLPGDHGGFPLLNAYELPATIPVLAVADGVVVGVSNGTRQIPEFPWVSAEFRGQEYDDHLIELRIGETITVNYAHVTDFHPEFAARVGNLRRTENRIRMSVSVAAGDTLGFVGPHGAMDFSVTDTSLDLAFLNRTLYPEGHYFAADVYDYLEEPLRSQMISIAARDGPPYGGKIDYDVSGRIVGNWFREGTTSFIQWSRQLAIVYDHLWSDRITISDGSPMRDVPGIEGPGAPDVWWVKGNAPRPEEIGVGDGVVHYSLIHLPDPAVTLPGDVPYDDTADPVQGVMLVEMIEDGRIRVEAFKGVTEVAGFTAAAKIYGR